VEGSEKVTLGRSGPLLWASKEGMLGALELAWDLRE
jgi:hypothetical protein